MTKKITVETIENYLDVNEKIDASTISLMAELGDNETKEAFRNGEFCFDDNTVEVNAGDCYRAMIAFRSIMELLSEVQTADLQKHNFAYRELIKAGIETAREIAEGWSSVFFGNGEELLDSLERFGDESDFDFSDYMEKKA